MKTLRTNSTSLSLLLTGDIRTIPDKVLYIPQIRQIPRYKQMTEVLMAQGPLDCERSSCVLKLFDARIHQRTHHDRGARAHTHTHTHTQTRARALLYVLRISNCPFHIISKLILVCILVWILYLIYSLQLCCCISCWVWEFTLFEVTSIALYSLPLSGRERNSS